MPDRLNVTPILSVDDPRIEAYRYIRERDLVGRNGHFIAEGEVVLRVLLSQNRHRAHSILIDEKRIAKLSSLIALAPAATPIYTATSSVLDEIAGFHLHRGILAIGACAEPLSPSALLETISDNSPLVVLCGIANHDNLGGIFRNAAALGAGGILLDTQCCSPFYRKALRVSVGATLRVPFATLSPQDDLFPLLKQNGFTIIALSPRGTFALHELEVPTRTAALFGTEGPGLNEEILAQATTISIPMANNFDSLNVATTSGIVLHHLRKPFYAVA